jgi:hypothetical protein
MSGLGLWNSREFVFSLQERIYYSQKLGYKIVKLFRKQRSC